MCFYLIIGLICQLLLRVLCVTQCANQDLFYLARKYTFMPILIIRTVRLSICPHFYFINKIVITYMVFHFQRERWCREVSYVRFSIFLNTFPVSQFQRNIHSKKYVYNLGSIRYGSPTGYSTGGSMENFDHLSVNAMNSNRPKVLFLR